MRREGYSHAIEVLFRWKVCAFFVYFCGRSTVSGVRKDFDTIARVSSPALRPNQNTGLLRSKTARGSSLACRRCLSVWKLWRMWCLRLRWRCNTMMGVLWNRQRTVVFGFTLVAPWARGGWGARVLTARKSAFVHQAVQGVLLRREE